MSAGDYPFIPFRFHVNFTSVAVGGAGSGGGKTWEAAFSECTGLEATMEPKVIKPGGSNYGAAQRVGPVTFGTVILKRGMTRNRSAWGFFSHVNELGKSASRLNVKITVEAPADQDVSTALTIELTRALPVKFKCADLNARASEVAIEELHLAHEGLSLK